MQFTMVRSGDGSLLNNNYIDVAKAKGEAPNDKFIID